MASKLTREAHDFAQRAYSTSLAAGGDTDAALRAFSKALDEATTPVTATREEASR